MSDRLRKQREQEAQASAVPVTFRDVAAAASDLDYVVTDDDLIVSHAFYLFNDETDEGAPPEIYNDPVMFRRWLEKRFPMYVCDGADCAKTHPPAAAPAVCRGSVPREQARKRTYAEIIRRFVDQYDRKPTPPEALALLKEHNGSPN